MDKAADADESADADNGLVNGGFEDLLEDGIANVDRQI